MIRRPRIAAVLLTAALAVCALAVDPPGDEATNRKLLKTWLEDAEHAERLKRSLAAFQRMPANEQARIRQLDKSLHEQKPEVRDRLHEVMDRYAGWLARLPEADRERINSAAIGTERLAVVHEILDRQWQESLPKNDRARLAVAEPLERAILLDEYRLREEEWRKLRAESRHEAEKVALFGAMPINDSAFRAQVNVAVEESLRPLLSEREENRLNAAPKANSARHLLVVAELSEGKLPIKYPGPVPPGRKKVIRAWKELPDAVAKKFPPKELNNPPAALTKAEGRWPEFLEAVVDFAHDRKIDIPTNLLGPTRLEEMPPSVQRFVKDELLPQLSEGEQKQLASAEGKWPDYPKKVKDLADKRRMPIPGIALPGDRDNWQRIRNFKPGRLVGGTN